MEPVKHVFYSSRPARLQIRSISFSTTGMGWQEVKKRKLALSLADRRKVRYISYFHIRGCPTVMCFEFGLLAMTPTLLRFFGSRIYFARVLKAFTEIAGIQRCKNLLKSKATIRWLICYNNLWANKIYRQLK